MQRKDLCSVEPVPVLISQFWVTFPSESRCERKSSPAEEKKWEIWGEENCVWITVCNMYEKKHRCWWASALVLKNKNCGIFNHQQSTGRINHCLGSWFGWGSLLWHEHRQRSTVVQDNLSAPAICSLKSLLCSLELPGQYRIYIKLARKCMAVSYTQKICLEKLEQQVPSLVSWGRGGFSSREWWTGSLADLYHWA